MRNMIEYTLVSVDGVLEKADWNLCTSYLPGHIQMTLEDTMTFAFER